MSEDPDKMENWTPFLVVAAFAVVLIYILSTIDLGQLEQAAGMAVVGIVVVMAYERFIGWGSR